MPKEKPAEETPQLPVSKQETQIQAPSILDKIKIQKKKIFIGLGSFMGILVFAGAILGAYQLGQRQVKPVTQTTPPPIVTKAPTQTPSPFKIKPPSLTSISLVLTPIAELLVTDPRGRRTGLDPRTSIAYNEIPDASYNVETYPGRPYMVFLLDDPLDGNYKIQVIGTETGSYTLDIGIYDELGDPASETVSGEAEVDSVDTYLMDYSSAPGVGFSILRMDRNPTLLP